MSTQRYEFSVQTKADSNGKVHLQRYGVEQLYEDIVEFREKFDEHPWLACCWYSSIVEQDYDLEWTSSGVPYIDFNHPIRNKVSSRVLSRDERWTIVLDIDRDIQNGWDVTVEPTYITLHENGHSQMIWVLTRPIDKEYANQLTDMVKMLVNDGSEDCFCHGFKGLVHDNPFLFEHIHEEVMYDPDHLFDLLSKTIGKVEIVADVAQPKKESTSVDESMEYCLGDTNYKGAKESRHMYTYKHIREAVEGSSWNDVSSVKSAIRNYQMNMFGSCESDAELENFARDFVKNKGKYNNLWTNEERSRGGKTGGKARGKCKARYGNKNTKGTMWINNGNVTKRIKKEEYDEYLKLGWEKGRNKV